MKTTSENITKVSFVDAKNERKNVVIEITFRNGYKELSICDDNGQGSFDPANDAQKRLQTLWDTYHLNDMHAGTTAQEEALKLPENWLKFSQENNLQTIVFNEMFEERKDELRPMLENDWKGRYNVEEYLNSQLGKNNIAEDIFHKAVAKIKQIREASNNDYEKRCYLLKWLNLYIVDHPETGAPYSYGSAWLHVELPADIEEQISEIVSEILDAEEERKGEPLDKLSEADLCKLIAAARELDEDTEEEEINRIAAAVRMFDLSESDLADIEIENSYRTNNSTRVTVQGIEYLLGTDSEMDEEVTEEIKDSLWAFNSDFLAGQTELPSEVFEALSEKCESGNDAIERIVDKTCGLDSLVEAAVQADGRAHFLNRYDGNVIETTIGNEMYFAYRQ
jgi:hypothetical protein